MAELCSKYFFDQKNIFGPFLANGWFFLDVLRFFRPGYIRSIETQNNQIAMHRNYLKAALRNFKKNVSEKNSQPASRQSQPASQHNNFSRTWNLANAAAKRASEQGQPARKAKGEGQPVEGKIRKASEGGSQSGRAKRVVEERSESL